MKALYLQELPKITFYSEPREQPGPRLYELDLFVCMLSTTVLQTFSCAYLGPRKMTISLKVTSFPTLYEKAQGRV